jgi:hypothetical protein
MVSSPLVVATATAQSVRVPPHVGGPPSARRNYYRSSIFMWFIPCRPSSATSPYQNKPVIYDLLMKAWAQTTLTIAADPEHLGARIGRRRSGSTRHECYSDPPDNGLRGAQAFPRIRIWKVS